MRYVAARAVSTRTRSYEAGDPVVLDGLTSDEIVAYVGSGAVVPARFIGTAAELAARNPIVGAGQLVWETDTGIARVGDGVTNLASLPIAGTSDAVAAALAAKAAFTATYAPIAGSTAYGRIQQAEGGGFYTLKQALAAGRPAHMVVLGDSTGDATDEWVYLLGQHIAAAYPAYNVDYRVWNDTTQRHDAPTVIQTGSGGRASVTVAASLFPKMYPVARTGADVDIAVRMKPPASWSPGVNATFLGQLGSSGNRVLDFWVSATGNLNAAVYSDGINSLQFNGGTSVATALTDNTEGWVRVTLQANDGGGNAIGKFYTSTDGNTWTQLGATVTKAAQTFTFPATSATQPFEIGGRNGGQPWTGAIVYHVQIRDGIDGPIMVTPVASSWTIPSGSAATRQGGPTLTVWNGSKSGANIAYLGDATRLPKLLPLVDPQAICLSDSHNEQVITGPAWLRTYNTWVASIRTRLPVSPLVVLTQNPRGTGSELQEHEDRCRDLLGFGPAARAHIIDIHSAFLADPRGQALLTGIHPSVPTGVNFWASVVNAAFDAA